MCPKNQKPPVLSERKQVAIQNPAQPSLASQATVTRALPLCRRLRNSSKSLAVCSKTRSKQELQQRLYDVKALPNLGISKHSVPAERTASHRKQLLCRCAVAERGRPFALPISDGVLPLGLLLFFFIITLHFLYLTNKLL
jgi:hypothetical protein